MQINYELTPADIRQAFQTYFFRSPITRIISCFLLLGVSAVAFAYFSGNTMVFESLKPVVFLALGWTIFILYLSGSGSKAIKRNPALAGPRTADITSEGLHIKSHLADSNLAWDLFRKWRENPHHFVLIQHGHLVIPLPKRAMTPEQQNELRELLRNHVKA